MGIRTAIIPAAGLGTRFLPITKVLPKEMLPLVDRPIVQFAVEQAVEAGIEQIIIVTAPGKPITKDYFSPDPELEQRLKLKNNPHLGTIQKLSKLAEITHIEQREPLGLGHAVLTAKQLAGAQPVIVYLSDEILIARQSATRQLLEIFNARGSVLGVVKVPEESVGNYGVIGGEKLSELEWRVEQVVEKPSTQDAPSSMAIVGPYALTASIFDCLAEVKPGTLGEIQLTDGIALLAKHEPVHALELQGRRHDVGNPLGLLKASIDVALENPEYASELRSWLKNI